MASRCRITLATTATNPAMPATVPIIAPKIDTLLLFVLLFFLMLLISLIKMAGKSACLKYVQGTCRRYWSNNLAAQDQKTSLSP